MRVWSGRAGAKRRIARWLAVEGDAGGGGLVGTPFDGPAVAAQAPQTPACTLLLRCGEGREAPSPEARRRFPA